MCREYASVGKRIETNTCIFNVCINKECEKKKLTHFSKRWMMKWIHSYLSFGNCNIFEPTETVTVCERLLMSKPTKFWHTKKNTFVLGCIVFKTKKFVRTISSGKSQIIFLFRFEVFRNFLTIIISKITNSMFLFG